MKKRIISLILVVVMSVLALAGCGYDYAKDDLGQYAKFDKAGFEKAIAALVIEDGSYAKDKRDDELIDYINELLAKKVDTADKLYEGVVVPSEEDMNNDKLYYSYYATFEKDGEDIVIYASSMKEASASNIQIGLSDNSELAKKIAAAFAGKDIKDYVYDTTTSGTAKKDSVAYITYTVETKSSDSASSKKTTYTNVKVTLGDHAEENGIHSFIANKLVDSTIGTALKSTDDLTDGNKTYSGAKVDWVVDKGTPIEVKNTTFEKSTTVAGIDGTKHELKNKELTYYIYPVYYLEVEDLSAESVIETLNTASNIVSQIKSAKEDTETKEEDKVYYRTLKDCVELLETYIEKVDATAEAEKALDEAEESEEKLQSAYDTAKKNREDAEKKYKEAKDSEKEELKKKLDTAKTNETKALEALEGKDGKGGAKKVTADAKDDLEKAEKAESEALEAVFKKAGADDAKKGKEAVLKEYKEIVHEQLLDTYNNEIKMNLAKEIWAAANKNTEFLKDDEGLNIHPEKAVKEVYDRLYESYEYNFYTGTESTTKQSYYKYYNGSFKAYLIKQTGKDNFTNAKHAVWAEAEEYVEDIIVVYTLAKAYDVVLDKDEIKEYKNDTEGNYNSYEYYQGERNAIVAYQFDTLMDSFLTYEETDEGEFKYTNKLVKYEIKSED